MADIDKLAEIIVNSNTILGKKIDGLTTAVKAQKNQTIVAPPVVPEVKIPPIRVPKADVEVKMPDLPKIPTPKVTVKAPKIKVKTKAPIVDLSGVARAIKGIKLEQKDIDLSEVEGLLKEIKDKEVKDSEGVLNEILTAIKEMPEAKETDFSELLHAVKNIRITGHGGVSSKRNVQNATGQTINPSTEEKQDDIIEDTTSLIEEARDRIDVLEDILLELKIANAHNCILTGRNIDADSFN